MYGGGIRTFQSWNSLLLEDVEKESTCLIWGECWDISHIRILIRISVKRGTRGLIALEVQSSAVIISPGFVYYPRALNMVVLYHRNGLGIYSIVAFRRGYEIQVIDGSHSGMKLIGIYVGNETVQKWQSLFGVVVMPFRKFDGGKYAKDSNCSVSHSNYPKINFLIVIAFRFNEICSFAFFLLRRR